MSSPADPASPRTCRQERGFWLARMSRTIFFLVVVLTLAGIYAALQVPISVFPETNFPRVVIGVDNGVMPVEQMQVTITKPIEDAMNSVPGLVTVRSTTSRGSAEVSLFFDWNVDMYQTLQLADAALSKVRQTLPATARDHHQPAHLRHLSHPGLRAYRETRQRTVSPTQLWEIATYDLKPPLNRVDGVSHRDRAGRPGAGVPHRAQHGAAAELRCDADRHRQRGRELEHHRFARPV